MKSDTKQQSLTLSAVDERVLISLHQFHYLTIEQIVRYFQISEKSTNWLRGKLKALVEMKYLATQNLPRRESYGRNPLIYSLSSKGIAHLRGLGFDALDAADRPSSYLYLEHLLRLNDVLIAATQLEKSVPEISLASFQHDRVLKRSPVRVQAGNKTASVIPDAWVDFHLSPPFGERGQRVAACIELDRATVDITPFKQKIEYLTLFANGPYQAAFGTKSLTIAFIAAVGGLHRVDQMKDWTAAELHRLNKTNYASLFLFAPLPDGVPDPVALFTQPAFYTLSDTLVPLIEKVS